MSSYDERRLLEEKLKSLQLTIQFLCNTMTNVKARIDTNPAEAKLMLQEGVDNTSYDYK